MVPKLVLMERFRTFLNMKNSVLDDNRFYGETKTKTEGKVGSRNVGREFKIGVTSPGWCGSVD